MNQKTKETIDQTLIKVVQSKKPTSVQQLIDITKSEITFVTEQTIMQHVLQLQKQGKVKLKGQSMPTPTKLSSYLKTREAIWYWITIILATATALIVFIITENSYPLIYIRYALGTIFVLFLPGYSLIKVLFPEKKLDNIELIALSMGINLALVPITGLILNYTPWGIRITPITLSILILTIVFATTAIIKEHQTKKQKQ